MSPQDFIKMLTEYFGDWVEPKSRPAIGASVRVWAKSKSEAYLGAMWKLLRDEHDPNMGPPSLATIMKLAERASYNMRLAAKPDLPTRGMLPAPFAPKGTVTQADIDTWPSVEDAAGDRWLSPEDTRAALGIVYARLKGMQP